jgi:hypothetical protein
LANSGQAIRGHSTQRAKTHIRLWSMRGLSGNTIFGDFKKAKLLKYKNKIFEIY